MMAIILIHIVKIKVLRFARYDWLCFLNNDIIVSRNWNEHIIANMSYNGLEVATVCGVKHLENRHATRLVLRKRNKIKGILSLFG